MKKIPHLITLLTIILLSSCIKQKAENIDNRTEISNSTGSDTVYNSESLKVIRITDNIYQHISYLHIENYGNFPCNGMVFTNSSEAIVFDTPIDNSSTAELITFITDKLDAKVKTVISTHFHIDCIGGLEKVQNQGISIIANKRTIELIDKSNIDKQSITSFDKEIDLEVGNETVIARYFGEGHTTDNVVGYVPSENAIFGGCLIKSIGAGKGNLEDANTKEWPNTVTKLKQTYPNVEIVIPGHGEYGTSALFDYTIELFGK